MNRAAASPSSPSSSSNFTQRLSVLLATAMVLYIATLAVYGLIREREQRRDDARQEVSEKWGGAQVIAAPFLSIPYRYQTPNEKDVLVTHWSNLHVLPQKLTHKVKVTPEVRYRGIFEFVLYEAMVDTQATFPAFDPAVHHIAEEDLLFEDAVLILGVSDTKGIQGVRDLRWDGADVQTVGGVPNTDLAGNGFRVPVILSPGKDSHTFSLALQLRGASQLHFVPLGEETVVTAEAPWGTPSFQGAFLPQERTIEENHFSASWRVLTLNRPFPQSWKGSQYEIQSSAFGVDFIAPVDNYLQNTRSAKHAPLFIILIFVTLALIGIRNNLSIHPVQYILVGAALLVFYLLLLSFSEHIPFWMSYLIAACAVVGQVAGYCWAVLRKGWLAGVVAGLLSLTYGFLFVVLQLEAHALLLGSVAVFAALAAVMYLTRDIDWYAVGLPGSDGAPTK